MIQNSRSAMHSARATPAYTDIRDRPKNCMCPEPLKNIEPAGQGLKFVTKGQVCKGWRPLITSLCLFSFLCHHLCQQRDLRSLPLLCVAPLVAYMDIPCWPKFPLSLFWVVKLNLKLTCTEYRFGFHSRASNIRLLQVTSITILRLRSIGNQIISLPWIPDMYLLNAPNAKSTWTRHHIFSVSSECQHMNTGANNGMRQENSNAVSDTRYEANIQHEHEHFQSASGPTWVLSLWLWSHCCVVNITNTIWSKTCHIRFVGQVLPM